MEAEADAGDRRREVRELPAVERQALDALMSTTPPTEDEEVSMSGVSPVTVTVSDRLATLSVDVDVERLADVDDDALVLDLAEALRAPR